MLREVADIDFNIQGIYVEARLSLNAKYRLAHVGGEKDTRIWPTDNSGNFTVKSYYEHIKLNKLKHKGF